MAAIVVCDRCGKWSTDSKNFVRIEVTGISSRDFCDVCFSQLRSFLLTPLVRDAPDHRHHGDQISSATSVSSGKL